MGASTKAGSKNIKCMAEGFILPKTVPSMKGISSKAGWKVRVLRLIAGATPILDNSEIINFMGTVVLNGLMEKSLMGSLSKGCFMALVLNTTKIRIFIRANLQII